MLTTRLGFATIVASNYVAHARVLADSLERVHAGAPLVVLALDDCPRESRPEIQWVTPADIGIDNLKLQTMAAMYDVIELATALKPTLLEWALTRHESVLYLDPDIEMFAPIHDLADLAIAHGVVLTPHRLTPASSGGRPVDRELLVSGAFNLGFIGVGQSGLPFLSWWADRVAFDCVVAPEEGLFVDQRWLDLATTYFDHAVCRDPGANVAWWNLDERALHEADGLVTAAGAPLRFFHFSGFDPHYPESLYRRELHHPRPVLVEAPAARALMAAHADHLIAAGWSDAKERPYRYATTTRGETITSAIRRAYRWQYRKAITDSTPLPPSPFDPAQAREFTRWANPTRRVERLLRATHWMYRRLRGGDGAGLARYARVFSSEP